MIKFKINLSGANVCKFFNIDSIPYDGNGFSIIENRNNYFLVGKDNYLGLLHTLILLAFMKNTCPLVLSSGKPVIQVLTTDGKNDITKQLELLGYEKYNNKTMALLKINTPDWIKQKAIEAKKHNLEKPKNFNKAYNIMCMSYDRDLYKILSQIQKRAA